MADVTHATETPKHLIMSSEPPPGGPATPNKLSSVTPGGPQPGQGFIPSFADACKLVSAPYSCLVLDTHRRHIGLAPMFIRRKRTGIQEELDTELLKYSEKLKGVPLAYDNISILGAQGDICDDNGFIHMDIAASFVVFNPERGQKLLGVVNKLGAGHVGCLVHGCFNASIPKPSLVSVDTWREAGPQIGAGLEFEVNQIDADQVGVLLIRGRLERTKVQELLAIAECMESVVPDDQASGTLATPPEETPKKKKKKKQQQREEQHAAQTEGDVRREPDEDGELSSTVKQEEQEEQEEEEGGRTPRGANHRSDRAAEGPHASEKKKKKKKKDKAPKDEGEEQAVTAPEQHGSDSSGYLSDKPSRKRRLQAADEQTPREDPQTPKSKKKRKSDAS